MDPCGAGANFGDAPSFVVVVVRLSMRAISRVEPVLYLVAVYRLSTGHTPTWNCIAVFA